jgi:hypothetical protein
VKEKKIVHLFSSEFFFLGVRERTPSLLSIPPLPLQTSLSANNGKDSATFGNQSFLRFKKQPVLLTHESVRWLCRAWSPLEKKQDLFHSCCFARLPLLTKRFKSAGEFVATSSKDQTPGSMQVSCPEEPGVTRQASSA